MININSIFNIPPLLAKLLTKPLVIAIFICVFLSVLVFWIDHTTIEPKAKRKILNYSQVISSTIRNNSYGKEAFLFDTLMAKILSIDTLTPISNLYLNAKDTSQHNANYICGYVKVKLIPDVSDPGTEFYSYDDVVSKSSPLPSTLLLTSEADTTDIIAEIQKLLQENKNLFSFDSNRKSFIPTFYSSPNYFNSALKKFWLKFYFLTSTGEFPVRLSDVQYLFFHGIFIKDLEDELLEQLKDSVDFEIRVTAAIQKTDADCYLFGDKELREKILTQKYRRNIDDDTTTVWWNFFHDVHFYKTMGLTNTTVNSLYEFFPWWYVGIILFSILMYFFSWYYVYTIKRNELKISAQNKELEMKNFLLKEQTDELLVMNRLLEDQKKELTISNNTKDRFFSIIAHDLKNPIASLMHVCEFLVEDYNENRIHNIGENIDMLHKASNKTFKLLENLLTWARSQMGAIVFSPYDISVDYIVRECLDSLSLQAAAKNIKLEYHSVSEDCSVACDYNMILTVLRNLISNAIKFSENDTKILVSIVDYPEDKNYIQVSVKDQGAGIDKETSRKLFSIDEKVTSTQGTAGEAGTGLGLILCKEFIDKHNCKIWVESEVGVGTEFIFTLQKTNEYLSL